MQELKESALEALYILEDRLGYDCPEISQAIDFLRKMEVVNA